VFFAKNSGQNRAFFAPILAPFLSSNHFMLWSNFITGDRFCVKGEKYLIAILKLLTELTFSQQYLQIVIIQ